MKTTLLLTALLGCFTLSHAQTTPSGTSTSATQAASGTKNVGSDRADAPQAPGMQTAPISSGRLHSTKAESRWGTKKAASQSSAPKQ